MNKATEVYDNAQTLAYLSFIGLIVPIAGIILALLSKAKLKKLQASNEEDQDDIQKVDNLATWGLWVSVIILVFATIGYFYWASSVQQAQNDLNQAQKQLIDSVNP